MTQQKESADNAEGFELSAVKMRQLNKQPVIENSITVSEDKKWLIHKTTITDIKPVTYFEKVLESAKKA